MVEVFSFLLGLGTAMSVLLLVAVIWFNLMEFSKDLVKWILKTYGNQSNRGCKNDFCKS